MPTVVVVGPSKGGKTTLARAASCLAGVDEYIDLDQAADTTRPGWQDRGFDLLRRSFADRGTTRLIDVGAGFQHEPRGLEELAPHKDLMIAVMTRPEIVFARHPGRSCEEFMLTEFGARRMRIYSLACQVLDTSDDIASDQEALARLIRALLSSDD